MFGSRVGFPSFFPKTCPAACPAGGLPRPSGAALLGEGSNREGSLPPIGKRQHPHSL